MLFLGLDIGTGGTRAVVIDDGGKVVGAATAEHEPFDSPEIGWAEQDPNDWWRAAQIAIREVCSRVDSADIAAVGLSGQMHGAVVLDEQDRSIRPAIIWCDQRTEKQCVEITEKIGRERLISIAGNPAVSGFTLPKLLWQRENEPENWSQVRSVLLPKDYIRFRLSGDKASDVADSSGTLLFDIAKRNWSAELISEFEIDEDLFPRVFESTEITGVVSVEAAELTGLKAGTPIVAGAGDNAAGAVGLGIVKPGMMSATIGTSGVVFAASDKPRFDPQGRIHTLCHAVPNTWHNTGVTQAAGLSLKWFRDTFAVDASYDDITALAENVPASSDGAVWLPYLMGERTPHLDANARAALVGLTASHTKGHAVRAVMEGVAFSLKDAIEIFREIGVSSTNIRLGGGGATSRLWRQIQADVYGETVEIATADEGAAFGAAILAGVGAGAWDSVPGACDATITVADRTEPIVDNSAILDKNYKIYQRLYDALKVATNI
ncbi:MAG TPA: xylulokinase [Pyrinomonadaceae bacterium]|nr:xylulokinase [Pyrinomonadaceae bacterium]